MKQVLRLLKIDHGQSTVEAAFLIPLGLLLILLLLQPGIILYDRIVMENAAMEGCRVLITRSGTSVSERQVIDYVKRRLKAIPEQEFFHWHRGGCSYDIRVEGTGASDSVSMTIRNQVRLLPVLSSVVQWFGFGGVTSLYSIQVRASMPTQSTWVRKSPQGFDPSAWIGAWSHEC